MNKLYPNKLVSIIAILILTISISAQNYKGFKVAVYARAYEVKKMGNPQWLDSAWNVISPQLKFDKIYLETHRDKIIVDDNTIEAAKKFFISKGIEVGGGITYTIDESNRFETFCYTNPEHRKKAKEIAELTAKHFDDFILDDFFFTSCKCQLCINAKGNKTWTEYRLGLMDEAGRELIVKPAKAVNPKVKVIIKYPNWYEHFQGLGFNLENGPKIFDGIYTGTETRDPHYSNQHLQQYESYLIYRYFNNLNPGKNSGGWVDPFGARYIDRYGEQLWLSLFNKAPEVTLFDFRMMLSPMKKTDRATWQTDNTSFNFDEMMKPIKDNSGNTILPTTYARAAGYSFEVANKFISQLGNPLGIKSYKPYHSTGEDFLQNYLGMIGLPMDIVPYFPDNEHVIILTEEAKFDTDLVQKMKKRLENGKDVIITSGLLRALQGKGIEQIAEIRISDQKALVKEFSVGRWFEHVCIKEPIMIPQIQYLTNDSWEDISAFANTSGWPIVHQAAYGKGYLFVLTIPDNVTDLYSMPSEVLNRIRQVASADMPARIEGQSMVSLFVYDNGSMIVESFNDEPVTIKILIKGSVAKVTNIVTNETVEYKTVKDTKLWGRTAGENSTFEVTLKPHSFAVFKKI